MSSVQNVVRTQCGCIGSNLAKFASAIRREGRGGRVQKMLELAQKGLHPKTGERLGPLIFSKLEQP